jgi:probable HAF family extracellular repeat protein
MTTLFQTNKIKAYLFAVFLAVSLALANSAAASLYNITNLGTLGGSNSKGYAINASGQVTGGSESRGYGINDSGQVTGYFRVADGSTNAFITTPNRQMIDLEPVDPFADPLNPDPFSIWNSIGRGINASGQVTGDIVNFAQARNSYPFVTDSNGQMNSMYNLGAGRAINASGQVAGSVNELFRTSAFVTNSSG